MSETTHESPPGPSWLKTPSVARTGALIAAIGLLTKVTGFVRITALVSHLGAVRSTDAFLTAFLIPETLYLFLTEGAISAAFIPVFTRHALLGRESFHRLLVASSAIALALSSLAALALALAGHRVITWVAPGFDSSTVEVTRQLLMVVLPYIPLTCLAAVLAAALNASGRFGAPAVGPLLFNLAVIASVPWSSRENLTPLGIGVLVGGILQLVVQIPVLLAAVGRPAMVLDTRHPGLREILALLLPLTLTNALIQLQVLVERTLSSTLAPGVITNLNLVQKLTNLPLGLIGMAVAVPLFPLLSRAWHQGDVERFRRLTVNGLLAVVCLILPLSWLFVLEADSLIRTMFVRGAYVSEPAAQAAAMLRLYASSMPAISGSYLLAGAFLARGEATRPALLKGGLHLVNIVMSFWLIARLDWATIPACYGIMYNVNLVLLILLMKSQQPELSLRRVTGVMLVAAAVWGGAGMLGAGLAGAAGVAAAWRPVVVALVMATVAAPLLYVIGRRSGVLEHPLGEMLARLKGRPSSA